MDLSRRSEIADPAADPHEEVSILLLEERVESAVAALPARYRDTIRLYYAEECSYQEIAERMGCAEGTVRSRIHRARAMLRLHVATGADMSPRT